MNDRHNAIRLKTLTGALSLEAAIIIPFVAVVFVSLIYVGKIYFIQNQIHSAIIKTAHDLSADMYVMDRYGFVDLNQQAYRSAVMEDFSDNLSKNAGDFYEGYGLEDRAVACEVDISQWVEYLGEAEWGDDLKGARAGAHENILQQNNLARAVAEELTCFFAEATEMYKIGYSGSLNKSKADVLYDINRSFASALVSRYFQYYMTKDELDILGVSGENGGIDFSLSTMMLYDDSIEVVAIYDIEMPFGVGWFGHSVHVRQNASARVWTGSYGKDDVKSRIGPEDHVHQEQIYYLTRSGIDSGSPKYHYLSCLRRPLITSTYKEEVTVNNREICSYCASHYEVKEEMEVYYTGSDALIHLYDKCPKVYSEEIIAVTEKQAIEEYGAAPCEKHHCVAEYKENEE